MLFGEGEKLMANAPNELPLRCRGIAVVLLKKFGDKYKVLLMKRAEKVLNDAWCYIGGGIEVGEKAWGSAVREIREETGIVNVSLYSANICEQFYGVIDELIYIAPVFVGYVDESENVTLNNEHKEFQWLSFAEAKERATLPGNEQVLEHIEKYFVKRAPLDLLKVWG